MLEEKEKKTSIIFDLGGVLLDWNPEYLYRKMFGNDTEEMEYFLNNVCHSEWNAQQDSGQPFAIAIDERIQRYPKYEPYIRAFYDRWTEMIGGDIKETVEIFSQLCKNNYHICALSNWSAETFPMVSKHYEFLQWFDELVISGEENIAKPDPAIFQILLKRINRKPEQCLFIDDAEKNISAAKQLGFQTIHFLSPGQLRYELQIRKILPELENN